jgi:NAD-dependent SIR2 family protein deacetylase
MVFIGAGASASAGLATFRGVGALAGAAQVREDALDAVFPNVTHRAVAELVRRGHVKFVVSSNHDNLAGKAGVPRSSLAELFGNAYAEKCLKCESEMLRSTVTPALQRQCEHCGARLVKTGVRYGQAVPQEPVRRSEIAVEQCDVALVLGSGMHTNPFADLALRSPNVVVVNLGDTGADGRRHVTKVESDTDSFMQALCDALHVDVPRFEFRQQFRCGWRAADNDDEIELYVIAGAAQEAVTFAAECQFAIGGITRAIDPDQRWEFRTVVRRPSPPCASFQVTLEPKAGYVGAAPLVVNVALGDAPREQTEAFHFTP